MDNFGPLAQNVSVRTLNTLPIFVVMASLCLASTAFAQEESEVDRLLGEGWHSYSEELDFEAAIQAYSAAAEHSEASDLQLLEAYEYLAACRFALGFSPENGGKYPEEKRHHGWQEAHWIECFPLRFEARLVHQCHKCSRRKLVGYTERSKDQALSKWMAQQLTQVGIEPPACSQDEPAFDLSRYTSDCTQQRTQN